MTTASAPSHDGIEDFSRGAAGLRLYCFPHAGAGAWWYRAWARSLPASVGLSGVRWPGRERLVTQPAFREFGALVSWLMEALKPRLGDPFAFFGHSLGALVAFELARALRRCGLPQPRLLLVSGHRAPQQPPRQNPIARLPEPEFVQRLQHLGGTPPEVFAEPELRRIFLPLLRADFAAWESYTYRPEPPFEFPICAYSGEGDPLVSPPEVEAWQAQTRGPFRMRLFAGHHFYLQAGGEPLATELSHALAAVT